VGAACCALQREGTDREDGVESDGLGLEIEEKAVVQVFLNMKRNLSAVDGAIVGEADLDGDIEQGVVVRVNVERDIQVRINKGT